MQRKTFLPMPLCEAVDVPGVCSLSAVATAAVCGRDIVFVGSNDGFVYCLCGEAGRVSVERSSSIVTKRLCVSTGAEGVEAVNLSRIQSLAVSASTARLNGDSTVTIVVASVLHDLQGCQLNVFDAAAANLLGHVSGSAVAALRLTYDFSPNVVPLRLFLLSEVLPSSFDLDDDSHTIQHSFVLSASTFHGFEASPAMWLVACRSDDGLVTVGALSDAEPLTGAVAAVGKLVSAAVPAAVLAVYSYSVPNTERPCGVVWFGCVNGLVVIAAVCQRKNGWDCEVLSTLRGAGPITNIKGFEPSVRMPFDRPAGVAKALGGLQVSSAAASPVPPMVLVVDSSGKVICAKVDVREGSGGEQGKMLAGLTTSLLPDYVAIVEAKLVSSTVVPNSSTVDTSLQAAAPPSGSDPLVPIKGVSLRQASAQLPRSQKSHSHSPFPGIVSGIQRFVRLFRKVEGRRSSAAPTELGAPVLEQPCLVLGSTPSHALDPTMSASPSGSALLARSLDSGSGDRLGDSDLGGALLGMGPVALSVADVNGDGISEVIISTLGRFVAIYRYDPDRDAFSCIEAVETPTHMYSCSLIVPWENTSSKAWVLCGPSHVLVQCNTFLRYHVLARAALIEKMLVPHCHASGGLDT